MLPTKSLFGSAILLNSLVDLKTMVKRTISHIRNKSWSLSDAGPYDSPQQHQSNDQVIEVLTAFNRTDIGLSESRTSIIYEPCPSSNGNRMPKQQPSEHHFDDELDSATRPNSIDRIQLASNSKASEPSDDSAYNQIQNETGTHALSHARQSEPTQSASSNVHQPNAFRTTPHASVTTGTKKLITNSIRR